MPAYSRTDALHARRLSGHAPLLAALLAGIVLLASTAGVRAASPPTPHSSLWIAASRDSSATNTLDGDLRLGLSSGRALLLGAGRNTTPADQGGFDLRSWYVGLARAAPKGVGYRLRYKYWGQRGVLETRRLSFSLDFNRPDWSVSLLPEVRRIRLYTDPALAMVREVTATSTGIGASWWYYGPGYWMFGLAGHLYRYSKDPARLATYRASLFFSSKALLISEGLLDHSMSADLGYQFPNADVMLDVSRSVSAVDATRSDIVALKNVFYVSHAVRLGLELGGIDSQSDLATHYAALSFGYVW